MFKFFSSSLLISSVVSSYTPEALNDQVISLPGSENLNINFNQFSGYVKVSDTKNLHYWFVESQNNPVNDPIAFWTNGGPGCSGLYGFLTEMGPFSSINSDLTLSSNPYSWNRIANMVFIEQPCGVGFSYSDQESPYSNDGDYVTNDDQAAKDNYALINAFFDKFPQYRANDLYIASESYGGHYMPTLAKEIVDQNTAGNYPQLNFKGFAVGNPFTEVYSGFPAMLETYWGHQMLSKPVWDAYQKDCVQAKIPNITVCEAAIYKAYLGVGNINPYAIDYPVCVEDESSQRYTFLKSLLSEVSNPDLRNLILSPDETYNPCTEDYATTYMNLPEVRKALHVNPDITWAMCSRSIHYKQTESKNSMVPIYEYLLSGPYDLDILVFSGDNDAVCGTIGVQHWIWDLGYSVKGRKYVPYEVSQQMAGYATKFDGVKFGFVTVHGAGHEVPAYKPEVALYLWKTYLEGGWTQ
mmetsp:Transcript_21233/g.21939  ORF Transcript_21233/g.21939 Transcript_21233/m.21939 type:complete len:467 (-) Transcript_21233:197-1597(-)